jgi:hypothetical protein
MESGEKTAAIRAWTVKPHPLDTFESYEQLKKEIL